MALGTGQPGDVLALWALFQMLHRALMSGRELRYLCWMWLNVVLVTSGIVGL